jgi:hypothetical protein
MLVQRSLRDSLHTSFEKWLHVLSTYENDDDVRARARVFGRRLQVLGRLTPKCCGQNEHKQAAE